MKGTPFMNFVTCVSLGSLYVNSDTFQHLFLADIYRHRSAACFNAETKTGLVKLVQYDTKISV